MTATWFCHDCEGDAPSIGKARVHSKSNGPVYRGGKFMRHVLTQNATEAALDRLRDPNERQYKAVAT